MRLSQMSPSGLRQPADGDDPAPLLVVQVVGVLDRRQPAIAGAHLAQRAGVVPDGQHRPLGKPGGPPVLPAEVARQRLRQAQRRAEPGEGAGLAVVLGQDRSMRALGRGQRPPRSRGLRDHLRPADLVLEEGHVPDAGVDHARRRADRHHHLRGDGDHQQLEGDQSAQDRAAPPAGRRPPPLQRHRAGRDAHDHRRQRVVATTLLEPEPDHHEHRRPGERAQRRPPPHPDAADHGQRRARRQEHDRVGHVRRRRRVGRRLRALAVREGGAGPAVVDLPGDVRQQQDERDPGGDPWAARPQHHAAAASAQAPPPAPAAASRSCTWPRGRCRPSRPPPATAAASAG